MQVCLLVVSASSDHKAPAAAPAHPSVSDEFKDLILETLT